MKESKFPLISIGAAIFGLILLPCWGGIPFGLVAMITGYMGLKLIADDPEHFRGKGLAIAGMSIGVVEFLVTVLFFAAKQLNNAGII